MVCVGVGLVWLVGPQALIRKATKMMTCAASMTRCSENLGSFIAKVIPSTAFIKLLITAVISMRQRLSKIGLP